jgi:phytoene synthase
VTRRAVTSGRRKAALAGAAVLRAGAASMMPRDAVLHAPPLPETAFLVAAAAAPERVGESRAESLTAIFAELRRRDMERMSSLRAVR